MKEDYRMKDAREHVCSACGATFTSRTKCWHHMDNDCPKKPTHEKTATPAKPLGNSSTSVDALATSQSIELVRNGAMKLAEERVEALTKQLSDQRTASGEVIAILTGERDEYREALIRVSNLSQQTGMTFESQSFRATQIANDAIAKQGTK